VSAAAGSRGAAADRPRAGFRAVALAVAWRSIHNFLNNKALLIPALIFPLFFFASFAGGLSAVGNVPGFDFPTGYTAFQYCFVLLQSAAFGGVFTGFGIARDFETGFGRRYLLAATDRRGIIVGYGIAALGRAFVTWGVLTAVALVAGMQIDGSGVDLIGMYTLAILVNITATLWASGVALRIRSIQAGPLMQLPVFLILFLAPVYVPLSLLSGWIHAVASVNPITALLEAARGFISGDVTVVALAFGLGIVLPTLFAIWSWGGLRRAEAAG
jgi:ABC-2 type transport system permease protein